MSFRTGAWLHSSDRALKVGNSEGIPSAIAA
jgi:hypothetical protein